MVKKDHKCTGLDSDAIGFDGVNGSNIIVSVLLVAAITWFCSYLYYYLWVIYGTPRPIYGYLFFLAALLVVTTIAWWRGESLLTAGMKQKPYLLLWLLLYLACGIFAFLRSTQDQIPRDALIGVMKVVVLTGGFALLLRHKKHLNVSEITFVLLVVFASVANISDFVHPWVSTGAPDQVSGRGAGLYINANIAGRFVVLLMIPAIRPLRPLWRLGFVLIAGLGVSVTFSREAWIMWGFAVVALTWLGYFSRRYRVITAFFGLILGGGFVMALLLGGTARLVQETGINQYLTPNTVQRLGLGSEGNLENASATSRLNLIWRSLDNAEIHPFIGNGLGYANKWKVSNGPENMYLLFLVDYGIMGVLLYLIMLVILWVSADQIGKVMVLTIAIASFFSHHLLLQPGTMLLLGYIVSSAVCSNTEARDVVASNAPLVSNPGDTV